MAELLSVGLEALPTHAGAAVIAGTLLGVALPLLRKALPEQAKAFVPSALAVGIAFIVPAYYSVAMFLGALLYQVWMRLDRGGAVALGFAVASGLIAGEGLMGVVTAILQLLGVQGG